VSAVTYVLSRDEWPHSRYRSESDALRALHSIQPQSWLWALEEGGWALDSRPTHTVPDCYGCRETVSPARLYWATAGGQTAAVWICEDCYGEGVRL